MKFTEIPYERVQYEAAEEAYNALFRQVEALTREEDCMAVLERHYRILETLTPMDLCYIRHGMDGTDPFYAGEQAYYDETGPLFSALERRFHRRILESPFAPTFRKLLGGFAFDLIRSSLETGGEETIALEQEENALVSRYNRLVWGATAEYEGRTVSRSSLAASLQSPDRAVRKRAWEASAASWEAQRESLEEIYDKLVKNRDRQAKRLGYADYGALCFRRMNRIGYTREEVACFREQVKKSLVPIAAELDRSRGARLGIPRLRPYDGGVYFPEGNPVPLGDDGFCLEMTGKLYRALSPETGEYMDAVLSGGFYDVAMRPGKQSGGYCATLEACRMPFIFANFDGTGENAYIMCHEGGHGFYFYLKREEPVRERGWYTSEMAETHAMAMEFFTAPYMELFFGDRAEDYRYMHLYKAVSLILYECQQDEFQQLVYEDPGMTARERNALWERLEGEYFPFRAYTGEERKQVGARWQRIPHVFLWPFYAIDYALAQVCALEFFQRMAEDPAAAWQSYLVFCRASGNRNFPEALREAGLQSPFAPGCLEHLTRWLKTRL